MKVACDPAWQPALPVGSARLSSRPRWAPLSGCAVLPAGTVIASLTGTFATTAIAIIVATIYVMKSKGLRPLR